MKYDVYGVGNALVDIQAQVSDEVLTALDFSKGIMTLVDEQTQERVLGAISGVPINRCAGGSAANTIIGIADFGGKVAYAGKVGSDEIGSFFLEDMRELGVTIETPNVEGHSGTCVILITEDAERTMLTTLGVSSKLTPDDIQEDHIKEATYVYVEGYLFTEEEPKKAALKAMELAKKNGVKVAFTVSDPFLINLFRDEFIELIENSVDLLFCNEDEAKSLAQLDDTVECVKWLHERCENVAMTLGPNGSIIMHEGEVIPVEGVSTKAIDTTGAGDMYAAGLLYGITHGMDWKLAGHLASHAAARIVSQLGARMEQKFSAEEVEELTK
ncbi:5-dehydro-2-deoxygluconokinase [Polystyrenella longa]|uniref:5-dehydro-2-deoxygluconokinase n=1 Tax=Polystyrenella longa TaxID=2528007 RepID=A0A518CS32_9PLAN|nr:adenosine kinase [Polystyrenella longa]QDU82014.1 5-dehydro-2-deoxygluconokinase [Polystyrenella longa]